MGIEGRGYAIRAFPLSSYIEPVVTEFVFLKSSRTKSDKFAPYLLNTDNFLSLKREEVLMRIPSVLTGFL